MSAENCKLKKPIAHIRKELKCEICSDVSRKPVTLSCGHSFCWSCTRCHFCALMKCPTCQADLGSSANYLRPSMRQNTAQNYGDQPPTAPNLTSSTPPSSPVGKSLLSFLFPTPEYLVGNTDKWERQLSPRLSCLLGFLLTIAAFVTVTSTCLLFHLH